MRLRVIGECVIEVGDSRLGPEAEILFAAALFLGLQRGRRLERDAVAAMLWPGADQDKARHSLRQTVYRLKTLGAVIGSGPGWVMADAAGVPGEQIALSDQGDPPADGNDVVAGVGEFLPGYAPTFAPPFAEWVERERDRVHANCRQALLSAIGGRRARGEWSEVERLARRCLQFDPLNEEATLALAESTALSGSKTEAVQILDRYLKELGPDAREIRLPANVLRRRIAERLPDYRYASAADACFVGRTGSLTALHGHFARARAREGSGFFLWGPPGIGKSRLASEFRKAVILQGAQFHRHGCQPSDARRPLSVFMNIVPPLLMMPGALGCSPETMSYLKRLIELDPRATPDRAPVHEAAYLYANVKQSLLDLLDAVTGEGCVVLLLEDVHWMDPASWEILREMVTWGTRHGLLLVFTSRTPHATPDDDGHWVPALVRHELGPLAQTDAWRMLEALTVADRKLDDAHGEWCVSIAEGNPLYLRELAVQWVQTGAVQRVPASLTSLIEGRLDRLGAPAMRVLQACAILGRNSTVERLESVLGYRQHELLDAVEELERAGLLASDGIRLTTKHELLADAALRKLSETGQRLVQRQAGLVLEREIKASQSASLLWDCAGHWHRAGETRRVLDLITGCGTQLMEVGLPRDAEAVFERALMYCETGEQRLELLSGLSQSLRAGGRSKKLVEVTSASLNLRRQLAEDPELHHEDELVVLDAMRRNPEDMGQARFNLSRCVSASNADPSHRIRAAIVSIALADNNGESVEVQKAYEAVAPIIQSPLVDHFSRALLQVIYHTTTGDIGIAVAAANELLRGDWRKQRPDSIAKSLRYAAHAYRVAGMPESACEASAEALRIAERYTLEGAALTACIQLANIAMDLENTDYAKHWYEHASLWSARSLDSQDRWDFATAGGRLSILLRQPEEALARLAMGPEQILGDSILRSRVLKAGIFLRASKELGVSGLCRTTLGRDFLTRFPAFSRTIFQDFNAVTYFSLRSEEVGLKGATSDLQAYVHEWRRETAPLSPELTRLICQVGITPRPPTRPDHH